MVCSGGSARTLRVASRSMSLPGPIDRVRALLEEGEAVWAVFPGRQALVATQRRLFVVGTGAVRAYDLAEFESRREAESVVVLHGRSGAVVALEILPDDEAGLQALTIVGLLVALRSGLEVREGRLSKSRLSPLSDGIGRSASPASAVRSPDAGGGVLGRPRRG